MDPEIQDFIKRYYDACNTMKSENTDAFYADDPEFVFFDAAPFQYKNWNEYKEGAQKLFFDTTKTCKLTPNNDLKIYRKGDIAWFTLTFQLSAVMQDDSKMELDMRQSDVLEKRDGKWVIVRVKEHPRGCIMINKQESCTPKLRIKMEPETGKLPIQMAKRRWNS